MMNLITSMEVRVTSFIWPSQIYYSTSGEIREAMADPLNKIVEAVKRT